MLSYLKKDEGLGSGVGLSSDGVSRGMSVVIHERDEYEFQGSGRGV